MIAWLEPDDPLPDTALALGPNSDAPGLLAAGGALPAEQALPLYVRDKVAQTTLERQAAQEPRP